MEEFCGQIPSLAYDIVHAAFSLLQLYFIFKYGNVIVNKNRWLARFTFAHCLSSCLSFWVYTLYNETLDAIVKKFFPKEISGEDCYDDGYDSGDSDHEGDDNFLKYLGNVTTNAIYIWTQCEPNDTSIGNNMRCVVSGNNTRYYSAPQTKVTNRMLLEHIVISSQMEMTWKHLIPLRISKL